MRTLQAITTEVRAPPIVEDTTLASPDRLPDLGGAAMGSPLGAVLAQRFGLTAPFAVAFAAVVVMMTAVAWRPLRHVSVRATDAVPE